MVLLLYIALFLLAWWVFRDAQARGKSPLVSFAWSAGVFFFWIVALPAWLFFRPAKLRLYSANE